jgi:hypothetical protein
MPPPVSLSHTPSHHQQNHDQETHNRQMGVSMSPLQDDRTVVMDLLQTHLISSKTNPRLPTKETNTSLSSSLSCSEFNSDSVMSVPDVDINEGSSAFQHQQQHESDGKGCESALFKERPQTTKCQRDTSIASHTTTIFRTSDSSTSKTTKTTSTSVKTTTTTFTTSSETVTSTSTSSSSFTTADEYNNTSNTNIIIDSNVNINSTTITPIFAHNSQNVEHFATTNDNENKSLKKDKENVNHHSSSNNASSYDRSNGNGWNPKCYPSKLIITYICLFGGFEKVLIFL